MEKRSKKNIGSTSMTPTQLRHIVRPRVGFEAQLEVLIAAYRENPEALFMTGVTAESLEAELADYRADLAAEAAAQKTWAARQEARLVRGSHLYSEALGLYARAQVVSRTDTNMKRAIAGFEQFMRHKHKRSIKPVVPVTAPGTEALVTKKG